MRRRLFFTTLAVGALLSCAAPESSQVAAAPQLPALDDAAIVDLSYPYDDETIYWPTAPSTFELDELAYGETEGGYFYSAYALSTPEHGGTHLDAPIFFFNDTATTEKIPVERLIGPAVVIDVAAAAAHDADYELTPDDIEAWERSHGTIPAGAIVLLHTDWGRFWPDRKAYLGDDTPGDASNLHFPSYGGASARLLVEERKVSALGVDTASIDPGNSTEFPVHRIANGQNVSGLENVANLGKLPATGAWIVALPMKIAGGSGAPVRIIALLPADPAAAS